MDSAAQPAHQTFLDSGHRDRRAECRGARGVRLLLHHLQPCLHLQHPARPGGHQLQHPQHRPAPQADRQAPAGHAGHQDCPAGALSGSDFHRRTAVWLRLAPVPPAGSALLQPVPQLAHPLSPQQLRRVDAFQMGQRHQHPRPRGDDSHLLAATVGTPRWHHRRVVCLRPDHRLPGHRTYRPCGTDPPHTEGAQRPLHHPQAPCVAALLHRHPPQKLSFRPTGAAHGLLQPHRSPAAGMAAPPRHLSGRHLCRCFPPARRTHHGGLPGVGGAAACLLAHDCRGRQPARPHHKHGHQPHGGLLLHCRSHLLVP